MNRLQKKSLLVLFCTAFQLIHPTIYWDWQSIDLCNVAFSPSFMWGTTMIGYENDGYSKNSTWYAWKKELKSDGKPFTKSNPGLSIEHTNNAAADLQLASSIGCNTHCFSIDWSKVEPEEGLFDEAVLQEYQDYCTEIISNNMTPIIIMKDLSDPLWFGYLGGFEHEKNIYYFERYCLKIFETLGSQANYFITFWSPESYAILGYLTGMIPPGVSNIHRAVTVLKNQLDAHVRVYKSIKSIAHTQDVKIGITKHVHHLEPWHFWDNASCYAARIMTDKLFYNFFTTGSLNMKIPLPGKAGVWVSHTNAYAPKSLDFIGINYYGHGSIKNLVTYTNNPSEIPTDIAGITVYPEGLYLAIKEVSHNIATKLGIPMIITQNGIATTDDSIRELYIKRHIYALSKALEDQFNVIGYCHYSLFDNFAWGSFDKKFGLFSVDLSTLQRTLKPSSKYFSDVIKKKTKRIYADF